MGYSNSQQVILHCYTKSLTLEVEYDYSYDAGLDRYSNGDPGYPPSEELTITSVSNEEGEDMSPIFDRMDKIFESNSDYQSVWVKLSEELTPEAPEPDFEPDPDFDFEPDNWEP